MIFLRRNHSAIIVNTYHIIHLKVIKFKKNFFNKTDLEKNPNKNNKTKCNKMQMCAKQLKTRIQFFIEYNFFP